MRSDSPATSSTSASHTVGLFGHNTAQITNSNTSTTNSENYGTAHGPEEPETGSPKINPTLPATSIIAVNTFSTDAGTAPG